MPNHRFHGKWSYFQIRDRFPFVDPLVLEEADLVIPNNATGDVDPRSTIRGKRVTSGKADPGEKTLKLTVKEPGNRREYEGERVKDFPGGGEPALVIIGRFKDFAEALSPDDQKEGVKALAQDEGTWIIIK